MEQILVLRNLRLDIQYKGETRHAPHNAGTYIGNSLKRSLKRRDPIWNLAFERVGRCCFTNSDQMSSLQPRNAYWYSACSLGMRIGTVLMATKGPQTCANGETLQPEDGFPRFCRMESTRACMHLSKDQLTYFLTDTSLSVLTTVRATPLAFSSERRAGMISWHSSTFKKADEQKCQINRT